MQGEKVNADAKQRGRSRVAEFDLRDALSTIDDPDDESHAINELEAATQGGIVDIVQQRAERLRRLDERLEVTASNTAISTATAPGPTGILTAFRMS